MRSFLLVLTLISSCLAFAQQKQQPNSFVRPLPKPAKAVNDFSKFLTASEKQYLDKELVRYQKTSSNAIVILTLDSLTDKKTKKAYTIEEAALLYFNTWGIGDKVKNNGVLLMATRNPRRVRIAVGKGLEGILTDNACQQIIDEKLVPNFKQGLFFTGFKEAVSALEYRLDNHVAVADNNESYGTPVSINAEQTGALDTGMSPGYMAVLGLGILGIIVFIIVRVQASEAGTFTSRGYYTNINYRDPTPTHAEIMSGAIIADSSSSFDSTPSSPSAPDSYSGGGSDGGGASGSW